MIRIPETSIFDYLIDFELKNSDTSGKKGMLNKDVEAIGNVYFFKDSYSRTNYQFNSDAVNGAFHIGIDKPIFGLSLEQSFMGLLGVVLGVEINLSNPFKSSLNVILNENINLNNNSKSLGVGIKPAGILIMVLSGGRAGSIFPILAR